MTYITSPAKLIEIWQEIVECGKHYQLSIFDWHDDISGRSTIETILNNKDIQKTDYFYKNFKNQISTIDKELMDISLELYPNPEQMNWWENRIFKKWFG